MNIFISLLLSLFAVGCSGKTGHMEVGQNDLSQVSTGNELNQQLISDAVLVNVNGSVEYQVMEGFGATHLPLVYEGLGDVVEANLRTQVIEAVYNQVGITMGNLHTALLETPGDWDDRSNDNDDPNIIDWNGFNTFASDSIKSKVVDVAAQYGFDNYYLAQKTNIRWKSPWLNNIKSNDYPLYIAEAGEQILAGNLYWRDQYNIVPEYQLPFNEPLSGNKEIQGNIKDVIEIIKTAGKRLTENGFKVKFIVPSEETESKALRSAVEILKDEDARQYVSTIAYHAYPYGSVYASIPRILETSGKGRPDAAMIKVRTELRDLANRYELPIWMTEISHGEVHPLSFDSFRGRAIHIHDELVYANASAYFGMMNMWDSISQMDHFGNTDLYSPDNEGHIAFIDSDAGKVDISGIGYAIGHYARAIHKGMIRIESNSNNALVQSTAFVDRDTGDLAIVLNNNSPEDFILAIELEALPAIVDWKAEQSTKEGYWQPISMDGEISAESILIRLPGESVTTIEGSM